MPDQHVRRYWDACSLIAFIAGEAGRADSCRKLLDEAASGAYLAFTSAITLAEVTRRRHHAVTPEHRQKIERFFENPSIQVVNADRFTVLRAREPIWEHLSLRPNDAIHLASALRARCSLFYTYDTGLLDLDGKISGLGIAEPAWTGQMQLTIDNSGST
ncbi:MAG TPA: type II toxin-antitoxin system VapC family toxin [Thermomicrobiales bacterium]